MIDFKHTKMPSGFGGHFFLVSRPEIAIHKTIFIEDQSENETGQ